MIRLSNSYLSASARLEFQTDAGPLELGTQAPSFGSGVPSKNSVLDAHVIVKVFDVPQHFRGSRYRHRHVRRAVARKRQIVRLAERVDGEKAAVAAAARYVGLQHVRGASGDDLLES